MCGGSSSGPAVATAAGMALGGVGTDTSGSIRVPASLCGLVGIRPTLGLVPAGGVVPLAWSYDVVGPPARSAEDAGLLLEVLADRRFEIRTAVRGVRLGVLEQLLEPAEPYIGAGVTDAAAHLEAMGAEVVIVRPALLERARDSSDRPARRGGAGTRRGSSASATDTAIPCAFGSRRAACFPPRHTSWPSNRGVC